MDNIEARDGDGNVRDRGSLMPERQSCRERLLAGVEWMGITGKTNALIAWSEQDLEKRKGWKESIAYAAITEWGGGGGFSVFGQRKLNPPQEKELEYFFGRPLAKSVWRFLNDSKGSVDCLILERKDTGSSNLYYGWVPDSHSRGDTRTSANFLAVSLKAEDAEWLRSESIKRKGFLGNIVLTGLYPEIEVPLEETVILEALRGLDRFDSVGKSFSMGVFLERLIEQREKEIIARYNALPLVKRIFTSSPPALVASSEIDYQKMIAEIWGSVRSDVGNVGLANLLDLTEGEIKKAFGEIDVNLTRDNCERSARRFYDASWRVVHKGILKKPEEFIKRAQRVSVHRRANPNIESLLVVEVDGNKPWNKELSNDELRSLIVS